MLDIRMSRLVWMNFPARKGDGEPYWPVFRSCTPGEKQPFATVLLDTNCPAELDVFYAALPRNRREQA